MRLDNKLTLLRPLDIRQNLNDLAYLHAVVLGVNLNDLADFEKCFHAYPFCSLGTFRSFIYILQVACQNCFFGKFFWFLNDIAHLSIGLFGETWQKVQLLLVC